jgi:hypothetical protein
MLEFETAGAHAGDEHKEDVMVSAVRQWVCAAKPRDVFWFLIAI